MPDELNDLPEIRVLLLGCLYDLDRMGLALPAARLSEAIDAIERMAAQGPYEAQTFRRSAGQWGTA